MAADRALSEWKSTALRAYQRRTRRADALIAGAYLAGTNSRRMRRALAAVFGGVVSKPGVAKIKADWDAWNARALAEEPITRLILDGAVALGAAEYSHYISHMLGSWLGQKARGYRSIRNLKAMIEPLRLRR
jgi:hypothetical protein